MNQIQLLDCLPSTSAARIPRWHSTLQNGYISKYNDTHIKSVDHLKELIVISIRNIKTTALLTFSIITCQDIHPTYRVSQLHHDQLNIIARHLQEIKSEICQERDINGDDSIKSVVKKLTRRILKEGEDWQEWQQA